MDELDFEIHVFTGLVRGRMANGLRAPAPGQRYRNRTTVKRRPDGRSPDVPLHR